MKSKKPKKPVSKTPDKNSFTAGQVGALIESLRGDFRLVAEKQDSLENKINGIAASQAHTLERVTALELGQIKLINKVNALERKVDALERRTAVIEKEIKEIKKVLSVKVEIAEFKILESRVSVLERKVETLLAG